MTDTPLPACPECSSAYAYELGVLLICPQCRHEWSVTVVKGLKVKGSTSGIKAGTKVRDIRLVDGVDGHDIDCKIEGFGPMQLKSSVVRKA